MGLLSCFHRSAEPTQEENEPENPTPDKVITIYCWNMSARNHAVGHISMRLSDGTYISHWPVERSILKAAAIKSTYERDVELEGNRLPDQVKTFPAFYLWETKIKLWWENFIQENQNGYYHLATQNCAHIVSEAIRVGIVHNKELSLKNRLFKMPTKTLNEIVSLFGEWPRKDYMKFHCSRFVYIFGRKLYKSMKNNESLRIDVQNMDRTRRVGIDDFNYLIKKIGNNLVELLSNVQNSTQELSAYLREIYVDGEVPEPDNPMVELNEKAITFSDKNIFNRISNVANLYESNYANAISELDRICGIISYLHDYTITFSDTVEKLFESRIYLVELLNLELNDNQI